MRNKSFAVWHQQLSPYPQHATICKFIDSQKVSLLSTLTIATQSPHSRHTVVTQSPHSRHYSRHTVATGKNYSFVHNLQSKKKFFLFNCFNFKGSVQNVGSCQWQLCGDCSGDCVATVWRLCGDCAFVKVVRCKINGGLCFHNKKLDSAKPRYLSPNTRIAWDSRIARLRHQP